MMVMMDGESVALGFQGLELSINSSGDDSDDGLVTMMVMIMVMMIVVMMLVLEIS